MTKSASSLYSTSPFPPPRVARHCCFLAEDGSAIDDGIVLYFDAPASFTGEDVLELQGHGGPVVMQMLLARCLQLGARLAEPGEFTLRAFLNGKLDLLEAEAVADLISAGSSSAARSAMRSLGGEFSAAIHGLADGLVELRARLEAALDFPEEDIETLAMTETRTRLGRLQTELQTLIQRAGQGCLLQHGLEVVLAGQPNAGKSSLLNCLAEADLAIVTPQAGTTRDIVRTHIQIKGVPLHIVDTAGLRDSKDEIEQIGVARAWQALEKADLAVLIVDAREGETPADSSIRGRLPKHLPLIIVHNKCDLIGLPPAMLGPEKGEDNAVALRLSAKHNDGVEYLKVELLRLAGWQPTENALIARERHMQALHAARLHLEAAAIILNTGMELLAEELRLAQNELAHITGEVSSEDLLGEIFSRFCIGK